MARIMLSFAVLLITFGIISCATFQEEIMAAISKACQLYMKMEFPHPFPDNQSIDMSMVWYTPEGIVEIPFENASEYIISSPMFNDRYATIITIHGFNDGPDSTVPVAISEAYFQKGMYNVMLLNSSNVIFGQYPKAAYMSEGIGMHLAKFLQDLTTRTKLKPSDIHLIGISLGAQIAGWSGRYLRNYTGKLLHRITGLDPAGPCFERVPHGKRLYKDDADYVDIVHVNMGIQGVMEAVGHADYFANGGGPHQPGCGDPNCSHQRAGLLYISSLYDENILLGRKCDSWRTFEEGKCNNNNLSVMGYHSSEKSRGKYYFKTSATQPFGLGLDGATVIKRIPRFLANFRKIFNGLK